MLTAYYDLKLCPPTYDFVSALMTVEAVRRRRGDEDCKVVFLPGPEGGFRRDRLWPYSAAERQALMDNLVVPLCSLLPSCVAAVRQPVRVEPVAGSIGCGERLYGLGPFCEAMRANGPVLRAPNVTPCPRLVTITLRECEHWPDRNSNVSEWLLAANDIAQRGFDVVIVRDTRHHDEPLSGFAIDRAAAVNVIRRAELYASAFCNITVSNGPAWLAMALGAPLLMLRPADDRSAANAAHVWHFEESGIPFRGQVPGALASQRLVWAQDTRDEIFAAFMAFVDRAEHQVKHAALLG